MKGKYKTCFILPDETEKLLGDDGWEFKSSARLSEEIRTSLIESIGLEYSESYLGIDVYLNESIQMSSTNDDNNLIEFISFQVYGEDIENFKSKLESMQFEHVEIFVPSDPCIS